MRARVITSGTVRRWSRSCLAIAITAVGLSASSSTQAAGPTATPEAQTKKQACIAASEAAQQQRMDGKLVEAQKNLVLCASEDCPGAIRSDCVSWLNQVNSLMPSVVLIARDPAGEDLADVTVTMDGKPFTSRLDGKSVTLGPGEHVFRFDRGDLPTVEKRVILREGETARKIEVVLGGPAVNGLPPQPAGNVGTDGVKKSDGPGVLPWVVVGVGGATLITGGVIFLALGGNAPSGCSDGKCDNRYNDGSVNKGATGTPGADLSGGPSGTAVACSTSPQNNGCSRSNYNLTRQTDAGRAYGFRSVGALTMVTGGVITVGGLVYYFVARPSAKEQAASASRPWILPVVTETTRGLAVGGTF
jgi:hypothetical protein